MGRSGSAIELGADDAVNPPDMDVMAWLCGSLQLSRYLEAIAFKKTIQILVRKGTRL